GGRRLCFPISGRGDKGHGEPTKKKIRLENGWGKKKPPSSLICIPANSNGLSQANAPRHCCRQLMRIVLPDLARMNSCSTTISFASYCRSLAGRRWLGKASQSRLTPSAWPKSRERGWRHPALSTP